MRTASLGLAAAGALAFGGFLAHAQQQAPPEIPAALQWAYGYGASPATGAPAQPAPAIDNEELVRIPGSSVAIKRGLFRRAKGDEGVKEVPDWAPDSHPPMPDIVKVGRSIRDANGVYQNARDTSGNVVYAAGGVEDGGIRACGFCHSAHGVGHPGNGVLAGLPASYLQQQMDDFRNGLRGSTDAKKGNTIRMAWYAAQMTAEETKASVEYFAKLPYGRTVEVIETDTVPKTRVTEYFEPLEGAAAGTEPIAGRIIEVPKVPQLVALRAPNPEFIAYVPRGALAKGEQLTASLQCRACHGPTLGGMNMGAVGGEVPSVAGRSPSYVARQLLDMKTGARRGPKSLLMKATVDRMSPEDIRDVAAYVATLSPPPPAGANQSAVR